MAETSMPYVIRYSQCCDNQAYSTYIHRWLKVLQLLAAYSYYYGYRKICLKVTFFAFFSNWLADNKLVDNPVIQTDLLYFYIPSCILKSVNHSTFYLDFFLISNYYLGNFWLIKAFLAHFIVKQEHNKNFAVKQELATESL